LPDLITRRRFIAGATCPQCGETDKIFTQIRHETDSGNKTGTVDPSTSGVGQMERGCIACDFLEVLSDLEDGGQAPAGDWSPVKLLD